jgi:hypothetical protein
MPESETLRGSGQTGIIINRRSLSLSVEKKNDDDNFSYHIYKVFPRAVFGGHEEVCSLLWLLPESLSINFTTGQKRRNCRQFSGPDTHLRPPHLRFTTPDLTSEHRGLPHYTKHKETKSLTKCFHTLD